MPPATWMKHRGSCRALRCKSSLVPRCGLSTAIANAEHTQFTRPYLDQSPIDAKRMPCAICRSMHDHHTPRPGTVITGNNNEILPRAEVVRGKVHFATGILATQYTTGGIE